MTTAALRQELTAALRETSPDEIRGLAADLGITLAQLRELVAPTPCPSSVQAELLLSKIATTTNKGWLQKVREKAIDWDIEARGHDLAAERRAVGIRQAVDRQLATLRPPPPARAETIGPRGSILLSPPENVVDLERWRGSPRASAPGGQRHDSGPTPRMPKGDGFDWLR
jgi:hypothetical protein